jgi:hypothetical protein
MFFSRFLCQSNYDQKKGTVVWPLVGMFGGAWIVSVGSSIKLNPEKKVTVIRPLVAMSDCFDRFVAMFFGGLLDQVTNYYRKKKVQLSGHWLECHI